MNKAGPVYEPSPRWAFTLDFLPPSINHMYGVTRGGQRYLTEDAVLLRDRIRDRAEQAGFRPDKRCAYGVIYVLHMPGWDDLDVDSGLKALLDSALSSRTDHRVVHLLGWKRVYAKAIPYTEVEIWKVPPTGNLIDWMRELVAREDG